MRSRWLIVCLVATACGRPASESECREIVEQIAKLELRDAPSVPSARVAEEVAATKRAFQDDIMKQCVGRRITQGALDCVRTASSSQEIVDECFN